MEEKILQIFGPLLQTKLFDNNLLQYLSFIVFALFYYLALQFLHGYITKRLKLISSYTKTTIDDYAVTLLSGIRRWFLIVVSLYFAAKFLTLHPKFEKFFDSIVLIIVVLQAVNLLSNLIVLIVQKLGEGDHSAFFSL